MSKSSPGDPPATTDPEQESASAPAIPSFDSLRAPRRRSAVDLLVPGPPPPPPAAPVAPRPPEYADLLRLGVLLLRWSIREPVRLLHRLLG